MKKSEFVSIVQMEHNEAIAEFAMSGFKVLSMELFELAGRYYFGDAPFSVSNVRERLQADMDYGVFV